MRGRVLVTILCGLILAACGGDGDSEPPSTEQLQAWADELIGPDIDRQCETGDYIAWPMSGWEGRPDVPEQYRDLVVGVAMSNIGTYCASHAGPGEPTPLEIVDPEQLQAWAQELIRVEELDDGSLCKRPDGDEYYIIWTDEPRVPEPFRDDVSDLAISIVEADCPAR